MLPRPSRLPLTTGAYKKMDLSLLVFPSPLTKGGDQAFEPLPASQALEGQHTTDAHAVGYVLPDGGPCTRLRLGDLADLIDQGREPLLAWVFCDIDNDNHKTSGRWTPAEAKAHWLKLKGPEELDCAGFYSTRGGYRLLWRLEQPIPVSSAASYLKQFYAYLRENGIPVDLEVVEQWNTLYRLPRVNRDGTDLQAYVDLGGLDEGLEWRAPIPLERRVAPRGVGSSSGTRPERRTLDEFEWARLEGLGGTLENKAPTLKAGKPYAKKGQRQTTMFKLAAGIIAGLELDDPELAYQYLAPSTEAMSEEGSKVTLDALWDRCLYLCGVDKAKRAARVEVEKKVRSGQPPGIYHGASYYIRDTQGDSYRPPVTSAAICQALEQWCLIPGLETRGKGNKPLSTAEYLAMYFRQAVDVVFELGRERGVFLPEVQGGTLVMGCAPPVKVEPRKNDDVEYWLDMLGGEHKEKLKDWLATVRRTDRPTCALYLEGPPGTGKGLFASGVASLWGTGPTSYGDAVARFNSALMRNPIVHVDEFFQVFDGGEGFSGAFRSLIGESVRQLRRKNMPSATLKGCPRLVIGANNGDALKLTENLTKNDLDAIASRVLHIKHDKSASQFLGFLGGREHTANWVFNKDGTPGVFAQHVAYLEQTREVEAGARFIVEGELSDWHRDLVGSSGLIGATLAALAHHLHRKQESPGIQIDQGVVWVNVPTLRGIWSVLTGNPAPNEGPLAKALKTLAGGVQMRRKTDTGRLRFYAVQASDIFRRAEMLQIGDADDLQKTINPESVEHEHHTN